MPSFQTLSSGGGSVSAANDPNSNFQYKRHFQLLVTDLQGNAIDLSALHCKFVVKRSSNQTPNSADIRVYNLSSDLANQISATLAPSLSQGLVSKARGRVLIQGGYDANYGVIFNGNIRQIIIGRESATDTFMDLNCGDGDFAYNYAIVNTSISAAAGGVSAQAQLQQIAAPMADLGTALGTNQPSFQPTLLPRGKTLWGGSREYMRTFAQQNFLNWSIQNGQVQFVPQQGYSKGISVVLTSKTGMVGTPKQTNVGVDVQCLMNPLINPGQTIKIDNASVAKLKIDLNSNSAANVPPPLTADGVYTVLIIEQSGDNRGVEWYSKLICLSTAITANPLNSVQVSYGP